MARRFFKADALKLRSEMLLLLIWCGCCAAITIADKWSVFTECWPLTMTMRAGSFIVGATTAGGGGAFPVMTLVLTRTSPKTLLITGLAHASASSPIHARKARSILCCIRARAGTWRRASPAFRRPLVFGDIDPSRMYAGQSSMATLLSLVRRKSPSGAPPIRRFSRSYRAAAKFLQTEAFHAPPMPQSDRIASFCVEFQERGKI